MGSIANLRPPWKPGQSGNPAGPPKGHRKKLEAAFLQDLHDDWIENGKDTLVKAREKDPIGYVKVAASLMPKQLEDDGALDGISRDELRSAIDSIKRFVALGPSDSVGSETSDPESA